MMYNAPENRSGVQSSVRQALYLRLMDHATCDPCVPFLAQMLASWSAGEGALPRFIGLEEQAFHAMLDRFFPGAGVISAETRNEVEPDRAPELKDVLDLLIEHKGSDDPIDLWIAQIVATGCMGADHLWSDLGLFARKHLTEMLTLHFPELAKRNDKNMRWKKFFYRQLCAKEGFILCRSPSCESCSEFSVCFAPEDDSH